MGLTKGIKAISECFRGCKSISASVREYQEFFRSVPERFRVSDIREFVLEASGGFTRVLEGVLFLFIFFFYLEGVSELFRGLGSFWEVLKGRASGSIEVRRWTSLNSF